MKPLIFLNHAVCRVQLQKALLRYKLSMKVNNDSRVNSFTSFLVKNRKLWYEKNWGTIYQNISLLTNTKKN